MNKRWVSVFLVLALFGAGFALWKVQRPAAGGVDRGSTLALAPAPEGPRPRPNPGIEEPLPAERSAVDAALPASVASVPTHLVRGRVVDERRFRLRRELGALCSRRRSAGRDLGLRRTVRAGGSVREASDRERLRARARRERARRLHAGLGAAREGG